MRTRVLLLLASIVLGLGLVETGLRILERTRDDSVFNGRRVPDAVLEWRVPPSMFHHDQNGFRNDAVPEEADVVVLGDSQSWGLNVRRITNWPSEFARLSGLSVYNMGMVGYGPAQYAALVEQARTIADIIVVQLYLGNDFADAVRVTYSLDHYRNNRLDALMNGPATRNLDKLEKGSWIATVGHPWWERTAIGRLLWPWGRQYEASVAWGADHPDEVAIVRGQPISVRDMAVLLDFADPAIAEGARLTRVYLDQIKAAVGQGQMVVLLFPAKASAVRDLTDNPRVRALAAEEIAAAELVEAWCRATSTRCVNPVDQFRSALAAGQTLYTPTPDRHPNALGYHIVADVMAHELDVTRNAGSR